MENRALASPTSRGGVLTLACPDRPGIVAAVAGALAGLGLNITEANQFNDAASGDFFMRAAFEPIGLAALPRSEVEKALADLAERFGMTVSLHGAEERLKVLIGVSKFGHCLYDLLHRWRTGALPIEVVGVFSNHDDMRSFVEWNGLPYHHFPMVVGGGAEAKANQDAKIKDIAASSGADLVVLARYMQILSTDLCAALQGRCINIHHSFLPSFKGAKPYHQAHARGVKIIGATAHYVTADLDEGPIIEQAVERVNHGSTPADLVDIGRDIEARVLARAVKWHAERRVMLSGQRTIVFS